MGFSPFGFIPDILSGKDPKKALEDAATTAALMGAVVATGGAAAPALAGEAAATGAGSTAAASGATSGGLLGAVGSYVQPATQALGAANMAKGLLSDAPHPPGQPPQINGQGSQTLAQLAQQGTQMTPEDQARMQAMMQRKQMWG